MTTQTKRRSIFERFMPKKEAEEAEGLLLSLGETVVNSGVEKKELGSDEMKLPDEFNEKVYDLIVKSLSRQKDIAGDMAKAVDALLIKVGGDNPEGLRNKLIATVMGHLAALTDEVEDVGDEELITEEEVPTNDEMPEEIVDEEEEEELMGLSKALIKENNEMHADVKALAELVPAFIGMAATIKELVPLVQASSKVDELQTKMLAMEKKLASRPRIASKDKSNIFTDKKVLEEMKEGTEGESTFFGHKVKKS